MPKSLCTTRKHSGELFGNRCSGSIYYEFTACPAAEFAIRHGLADIMPALCNVDFASMELIHAKLIRTTTCANGCKCDFTICGDRDPYIKNHPEYRDENGYRRNP